ncbi:hypothetical protein EPR50_G00112220 [Perca flavescens]|uniref:Uncharacterized protein n=1 Tax=Perca flavescens TaxID=8167 RepID=A0A484CZ50_PERFV|nr:hypothetical protein EPR50_G00112220 [Perca flavescens]
MVTFLLAGRCRCEPWFLNKPARMHGFTLGHVACRRGLFNGAHRLADRPFLTVTEHTCTKATCPRTQSFHSRRLPPISPCKKPFASEHHRLQNSKCSAALNGVT